MMIVMHMIMISMIIFMLRADNKKKLISADNDNRTNLLFTSTILNHLSIYTSDDEEGDDIGAAE